MGFTIVDPVTGHGMRVSDSGQAVTLTEMESRLARRTRLGQTFAPGTGDITLPANSSGSPIDYWIQRLRVNEVDRLFHIVHLTTKWWPNEDGNGRRETPLITLASAPAADDPTGNVKDGSVPNLNFTSTKTADIDNFVWNGTGAGMTGPTAPTLIGTQTVNIPQDSFRTIDGALVMPPGLAFDSMIRIPDGHPGGVYSSGFTAYFLPVELELGVG